MTSHIQDNRSNHSSRFTKSKPLLRVARAFKAASRTAAGQLHDRFDDIFSTFRVDEMRDAELAGAFRLNFACMVCAVSYLRKKGKPGRL